ncbi:MAG: tyrosine-type recombinase/integrase [Melioribacteraceae bacterium]
MFLTKRPSGTYYLCYTQSNGKRTTRSTSTRIKKDALKFLADFHNELATKENNKIISISFSKYSWKFLKYSESVHSEKSSRNFKRTFKYFMNFTGDLDLIDITRKSVIEYLDYRVRNPSIYQARIDLINLSSAFNRAISEGYLLENPCAKLKQFKLPQKAPKYFSEYEYQVLLDSIKEKWFKNIVELAYNSGMRQMEILTLRWSQIDLKNDTITLNNHFVINKGKKVQTVYLSRRAKEIIIELYDEKNFELVFHNNFNQYKQDHISKKFKRYVKSIDVNPSLNFHSLRHTFASRLVQNGTSLYIVQKLLHHQDFKTTQVYSHLRDENLKDAIKQLDI